MIPSPNEAPQTEPNEVVSTPLTPSESIQELNRELLAMTLPKVPVVETVLPSSDLRGYRPMNSEIAHAQVALDELAGVKDWDARFGITAPPVSILSGSIEEATRWTVFRKGLMTLVRYVKGEEAKSWMFALQNIEDLKAPFDLAMKAAPTRMKDLPALGRLLHAQKEVGKRAAATRARRRKATRDSSTATAAAPETAKSGEGSKEGKGEP